MAAGLWVSPNRSCARKIFHSFSSTMTARSPRWGRCAHDADVTVFEHDGRVAAESPEVIRVDGDQAKTNPDLYVRLYRDALWSSVYNVWIRTTGSPRQWMAMNTADPATMRVWDDIKMRMDPTEVKKGVNMKKFTLDSTAWFVTTTNFVNIHYLDGCQMDIIKEDFSKTINLLLITVTSVKQHDPLPWDLLNRLN